MRMLVGVSLDRDRARAVGVTGDRVAWGVNAPIDPAAPLADALAAFLGQLPLPRWPRPRLTVALGSAFAQTKRLAGLPPLADERLLARAVDEHVGRFFLKNGIPLVTTSVRVDSPDVVWAAALDQPVVAAVESACRTTRVRLHGIVPVVDVVGRGLALAASDSVTWRESGPGSRISWINGRLIGVSRHSGSADPAPAPIPVAALSALGDSAWRFAAAYGATQHLGQTLVWRSRVEAADAVPRWRLGVAGAAAALALCATLLVPALSARLAERRTIAHLGAVGPARQRALRIDRETDLVTRALGEVAAFDAGRRPVTLILGALARALPAQSAVVALHVDSLGGSVVALAPRAGAVLTALEHVPGVAAPEIVGPVTRELTGSDAAHQIDVERATMRFRWLAQ